MFTFLHQQLKKKVLNCNFLFEIQYLWDVAKVFLLLSGFGWLLFVCWDTAQCITGQILSDYVAEGDLEPWISLPLPPEFSDYRHVPSYLSWKKKVSFKNTCLFFWNKFHFLHLRFVTWCYMIYVMLRWLLQWNEFIVFIISHCYFCLLDGSSSNLLI